MKFKLDENVPFSIKSLLEAVGDYHVDSVFHENKTGIDDHSLLHLCLKEAQILITLDTDFNNPIMHPKESLFGIIILRPSTQGKTAVNALMTHFLDSYNLEDCKNKVLLIDLEQIIIRWDCV